MGCRRTPSLRPVTGDSLSFLLLSPLSRLLSLRQEPVEALGLKIVEHLTSEEYANM